jgi:hypothetical protein
MFPPEQTLAARNSLTAAMTVIAGAAFGCALAGLISDRNSVLISSYFFAVQDAPVLLLLGLFLAVLVTLLKRDVAKSAIGAIEPRRAMHFAWIAVAIGCCIIWAGSFLVYRNFGLSMDEFMAEFDAGIIATGKLVAAVAPDWRAYVPALQPIFRLELPDNAYWSSAYLPMNAAIRAVFVLFGAPALEGVVLAAIAIIALFGVARRLWPDRPDAAVVAIILLVCSSQFLITAMTPYAMTAHLALNMAWLWLFLRDTRAAHVLAAGVAFVACGLHQVVFHPLFAAPFVVSLLLARRWKLAAHYITVYGVIGLFWILYWTFVLRAVSVPVAQSADLGMLHFFAHVATLVDLSPAGFFFMGVNLLRFLAWQTPILIPLAVVGLLAGHEQNQNRTNLALAAGIALTLAAMLVLMPYQGHGWGYRYLHGFLGSLALIAAQGWIWVTGRGTQASRAPALAVLLSALGSLFVLLPWQAYQVHAFVNPYASAVAAIEHSGAEVVIVDPTDIWFGEDLVRNDPFLRTAPKVLSLPRLDETRLSELCRRGDVAIFDREDAQRLGMRIVQSQPDMVNQDRKLRTAARSLGCGRPVSVSRS